MTWKESVDEARYTIRFTPRSRCAGRSDQIDYGAATTGRRRMRHARARAAQIVLLRAAPEGVPAIDDAVGREIVAELVRAGALTSSGSGAYDDAAVHARREPGQPRSRGPHDRRTDEGLPTRVSV
jgi:hypothetical protein